jgi:hypothetical protein
LHFSLPRALFGQLPDSGGPMKLHAEHGLCSYLL